ncbi:MAG: hypothetical protein WD069_22935 [Planctomycetales bacterium]
MRSRRRARQPDSLELLLDTVCNTFGGVLFIAILVVILLETTGHRNPSTAALPPVPRHELDELELELERKQAEIESLRRIRDDQDVLLSRFATPESQRDLRRRSELRHSCERLHDQQRELVRRNAGTAAEVEEIRDRAERTVRELATRRSRVAELEATVERKRRAREQPVRMPVARMGRKSEVGIVVRYGRMYVWHEYDANGVRRGLNTAEFVVVEEGPTGLVTRPNPTAGVALDDAAPSVAAVRRRLRAFDPQRHQLAVIVRQDSYGNFRHLRDAMVELEFDYRILPMTEGGSVVDRGGSGSPVQ